MAPPTTPSATEAGHPLRAAVIGTGTIAEVHRRAIHAAGGDVVGVLASSPARSLEVARRWGATPYEDLPSLLADGSVDVVHVCTPNHTHADYTVQALTAGKHVVCEKPLGVSVEQAERLAAAAERSGLTATVPFVYRYHPLVREIRRRRLDGEFGRWHLLHGSYLQDWMLSPEASGWRVDPARGGASRAFADIGSHWCDLVQWVSGETFTELTAASSVAVGERPAADAASFSAHSADGPRTRVETEDCATLLLRTQRGLLASLTVSQVSAGRKNRLWFELDGSHGSAVFDQENPETIWLGAEHESRVVHRDPNHGSAEQRRLSVLPAGHPQGYADCFAAFVSDTYAAIRGAAPEGLPTFADGLRAARLVDAFLSSSRTGDWTKVKHV
ncbi:Gfo/Idh/MocA family protein [Streptomyces coeruleorubidus]|uniref:Gfo/Idh/MocA family oxidoreductase n=1 Tax=Streptomyces coeruleorubidus TaxID=116188 RepID=A0ABZ0KNF0_STRC4|nr:MULTISPECIES: Gfo/Idh/MocA family oxidoreductase [Streptomyces]WOT39082.1 Gfo/Idh/MocA family oxidoreductase [Streptomyces coeruleorubidus]GGU41589.1 dehydrogenase [Streptomyces bellus]